MDGLGPLVPAKLGPYVLGELLGRGGMGAVYRALDERLNRNVALKLMLTGEGDSDLNRKRFLREMKAMAGLSHPHIIKILDVGEHEGFPYLAMELLAGRTLREQVTLQGPLPQSRVISIGIALARALAELHAHQMIHRDINPKNVIVLPDGRPILMDLGLVKVANATVLTEVGSVVGTPRYLAPEVVMGAPGDVQTDVYQLGLVLYEAATNRVAFGENSVQTLLTQVLAGKVARPIEIRPDIDPALDEAILWMIARNPAQRAVDASSVAQRLELLRDGKRLGAPGAVFPSRGRGLAVESPPPEHTQMQRSEVPAPRPAASPPARPARPGTAIIAGTLVSVAAFAVIGWRHAMRPVGPAGVVERSSAIAHRASGSSPPATPVSSPPSPPATSAPGMGEPQPVRPSPAAGYYTGGWKPYLALLPRLKAGGETAARAVAILRRSVPIDITGIPIAWAHWFELNEWLADPRRPWPPPEIQRMLREYQKEIAKIGDAGFADGDYALQQIDMGLSARSAGVVFEALMWGPEDGRRWLILGHFLEMDGRPVDARVAYTRALEKLEHHSFAGRSVFWEALAKALDVCGGQTRLRNDFESYVGVESNAGDVLYGLSSALSKMKMKSGVFCEFLRRYLNRPLLGAVAHLILGDQLLAGTESGIADPDAALSTWKEGLTRSPGNQDLETRIVKFHLERGDSTAALAAAGRLPKDNRVVSEIALVTMPDVNGSHRPELPAWEGHPSELLPFLVYRLLEAGDFEAAARELKAYDSGEFFPELISPILYDLLGHGIDRAWFAVMSEKALFGRVPDPNAMPLHEWTIASGEYATGTGVARMERLLGLARKRWTTDPVQEDVQLVQALWLSRRGDDDAALGILRAVAHSSLNAGNWLAPLCEIASRPIWKKAMGDASAAGAAAAAIALPGPTYEPCATLYRQALAAGDFAQAAALAQKLFYMYPQEPVWSLVPLWDAVRTGNRDAFRVRLTRARIANRHNRSGVWLLHEMEVLEKHFADR